jgi:hypothetical protein
LRAAIATVEHFEGRIELGPYGEVQVLFPPMLTAPTQTPPSAYASDPHTPSTLAHDPLVEQEARRHAHAAVEVIVFCAPVATHMISVRKKGEKLSAVCPPGQATVGGGVET